MIHTPDDGTLAVGDLAYLLHPYRPDPPSECRLAAVVACHHAPDSRPEWVAVVEPAGAEPRAVQLGAYRYSRLLYATRPAAEAEVTGRRSEGALAQHTRDADVGGG